MENNHRCPFWVGYLLASPLRKLVQNPRTMLAPYVKEGMTVLDIGCAMGFFSIPLAEMVGPTGRVVCVDIQEKMLHALEKRADKAGVSERIERRLASETDLNISDLSNRIDFIIAFAVVHEVKDAAAFFCANRPVLKKSGRLLFSEPAGHVSQKKFEIALQTAAEKGFSVTERPAFRRARSAVLEKGKTRSCINR